MNKIDFTKYNRLFTFGCSFTRYDWPTWADILSIEFTEYYNYGKSGAGNHYIMQSLIEAHARHNITDNDLVLIMWSTVMREDRYTNGVWHTGGSVYNNSLFDNMFIEKYVDPYGFYVRDLGYISAAKCVLDGLKIDYEFMSMSSFDGFDEYGNGAHVASNSQASILYQPALKRMRKSFYEFLGNEWPSESRHNGVRCWRDVNGYGYDQHPSPEFHYRYLQHLFPATEFTDATQCFVKFAEDEVRKTGVFNFETQANLTPSLVHEFCPHRLYEDWRL